MKLRTGRSRAGPGVIIPEPPGGSRARTIPDGIEMSANRKAIVVGAGLAGLGAAHALRKRGIEATVLEASPRPGGRIFRQDVDGFRIDMGANLFLESFDTIRKLAGELGVPLRRTPVAIHSGIYRNGRFHGLYGDDRPGSQWKTARTMLSFRLLSPRGLWEVMKFAGMLKARGGDLSFDDPSRMLDLDTGESAAEFFEANIGAEALEWLFGPGLSGYLFAQPEQVGAACAMATLWHTGLSGLAWPVLPEGGTGAFVDALARACGGGIRLSTPVRRIVLEDGAVRGVATDAGFAQADAAICATTATATLELAPNLPSQVAGALRRVTYSRCCRVFFGVDSSPFPRRNWYAVSFPRRAGTLMTGMSNSAVLAPESAPEGKALVDALVIGEQARELSGVSDERVRARVLAEAREYLPAMSAEPLFTRVYHWKEAACLAPGGAMTALERIRRQEIDGIEGLFLAGDYLGVPSANAALRSGIDAGTAAAEHLRRA